ncbi:hypothetical protein LTR70_008262 [Exophiala xenobiotica]|uniref:Major facilitator superfamily (MFS) profile domain-containing protein n=1 Tax=Lithohypha guttulata TaxID=1690604 RepID=A0ABR0K236_9EURO|nr:hypothetical protein LTR24_007672 [Lithohypha guttulata]KAK5312339.1 hypothetical protein LTR70_008262 [Exophiala xenobiotica]
MSDESDVENGKHRDDAATKDSPIQDDRQPSDLTRSDNDEQGTDDVQGRTRRLLGKIFWTPPWCRYDPKSPPTFSIAQNVLFAFAGAFTVANLYYNIAILNVLADDFDVSYYQVSQIPTLMQAGYAVGLLLICPLGDLFPRRPYTLILIFFTATLWIGLCVTRSFNVFLAISFITSITTVTPQIMLPLVGQLAPPKKRPLSLSIVVSGNMLGIVIARILSGVVAQYTNWRNIYWIALALQYIIFAALYLFMPAYPSTNPLPPNNQWKAFCKAYPRLLFSILELAYKHAVLVQAALISFCTSTSFTCFWTTLTFLLSSPPYSLPPTPIGLFGLIGIAGIFLGPLYAKYLIQPLKVPLYAVVLGELVNLLGSCIGTYTGSFFLGGPVIQAFCLDAALQITQIANRTAIYAVAPDARNRVNTVFMLFTFFGQIAGTAAGNVIYDKHGGWRSSGSLGVAAVATSFLVVAARGPWEQGWIGWGGGWGRRDPRAGYPQSQKEEREKNGAVGDRPADAPAAEEAGTALETRGDRLSVIGRARSAAFTRQLSHGSDGHAMYGEDGRDLR